MVFLKEFYKRVDFEKKISRQQKIKNFVAALRNQRPYNNMWIIYQWIHIEYQDFPSKKEKSIHHVKLILLLL